MKAALNCRQGCRRLALLIWSLWSFPVCAQQNVQFSQYVFNGMALNPAYAGYQEETNFHLVYRNQWTGIAGSPKTISASLDGLTPNQRIGLGAQLIKDELGAQSNLSAMAVFSYRVPLSPNASVRLGLGAGVHQYQIDRSKIFTLELDRALSRLQDNIIQPDLQFGVFYASPSYFLSFSANDLFANYLGRSPSYIVLYHTRHYYLQGGALWDLTEHMKIKPSILFKEDFLGPTNVDLNLFLLLEEKFWVGGSYRTAFKWIPKNSLQADLTSADAYSLLVEYFVHERFRIGYSLDFSTNRLLDASQGSHEISVGYSFKSRKKTILSPRYF